MPLDRFQSIDRGLLDVQREHRVLDLGCGTGRHVLELSKGKGSIIGADLSREDLLRARYLLEIMRRRGEVGARVHWLQTAGERLPFADESFDRVLCTETLEHVDDDSVLARELVRVLKPGGILAVSVPDEYSEKIFWKVSPNYRTQVGGHVRIYERQEIIALLRGSGLEPYAVRYRHSLETLYWLGHVAFWSEWGKQGPITGAFRRALDSSRARKSRIVTLLDDIGNRILPKSIVVYSRKPERVEAAVAPSDVDAPVATAIVSASDGEATVPAIAPVAEERVEVPVGLGVPSGAKASLLDDGNDERAAVEVRAVPAPFEIKPAASQSAPRRAHEALSLRQEFQIASAMGPEDQKRRLIEILRSCRFAMMREVADLSGEQAATPWTADGRSVKEIVGHITAWERWSASAFEEIDRGSTEPSIMSLSGYQEGAGRYASIDEFNSARMAEARSLPWAEIKEQSSAAFEEMIESAERIPDASLFATAPFFWPDLGGAVPCGIYLLMVAAHHYEEEHRPEVARG